MAIVTQEAQIVEHEGDFRRMALLSLSALGVVYGDIGTSPLYAMRECFTGAHAIALTDDNVMGVLSLISWALIVVISIKYVMFVMRADNRGEGGVLSLMALVQRSARKGKRVPMEVVTFLGLMGASLLYGDGMITPAISVLSAIEGLAIAAPVFEHYIVPFAILILCLLFWPQKHGTGKMGVVFGPIILVWFMTLATLGVVNIIKNPSVMQAISPWYAVAFFIQNKAHGIVALGAICLAITGGEALYADMGHFGRQPIRLGWFFVALPALLLNYFGQGALILTDPEAVANPFYNMAPRWALYPLIAIATAAAVIASQALITGAFSLTKQAVQLGYLPRLDIHHTSRREIGQIYAPFINRVLLGATIFLVIFFRSSSGLAAAYGIAVTLTMAITTILMFFIARYRWQWSLISALSATAFLLAIDLAFLSANLVKIADGGWFPLAIGAAILTLMSTWRRGRQILAQRLKEKSLPLTTFFANPNFSSIIRVPGCAVFMNGNLDTTPPSLLHNLHHNKVLHEKVIFLTVLTEEIPYVAPEKRYTLKSLPHGFLQVILSFGFMEQPDVLEALGCIHCEYPELSQLDTTYFFGRETLIATDNPGMAIWREKLFALLSRNAQRATLYYNIPSQAVMEVGMHIDL